MFILKHLISKFNFAYVYYSIIILIVGLVLVFIVPPFQAPDEQTHLYRAYQLSEGHITTKRLSYGAGDNLPRSLSDSFNNYKYLIFKPDEKVKLNSLKSSLSTNLDISNTVETRFENTAIYPPFSYLPQVIGISLGKTFFNNPIVLLYLARIFNLMVWVIILYICMKRQAKLALPIFAFALLPLVAFQASSASADVMTSGIALFLTLEIYRLASLEVAVKKIDKIIIIVLGIIIALCKPPYFLLVFLIVAIPYKKIGSKKQAYIFKLLACILPIIIAIVWLLIACNSFVNLKDGVNSIVQLKFILCNPIDYIIILYNTYISGASDGLYIQLIGQLGWLDTKLTFWNILFGYLAIILSIFAIPINNKRDLAPNYFKVWSVVIISILIIAITSLLYLTWNVPRASVVDGLQGRYFIPLIGLIIIIFRSYLSLSSDQSKKVQYLTYFLSGSTIISTIIILVFRYYSLT